MVEAEITDPARRLAQIKKARVLDTQALDDLATMLLDGHISPDEAQKMVAGKKVAPRQKEDSANPKVKIKSDGRMLLIEDDEHSLIGRLLYEMRDMGGRSFLVVHEVEVMPEYEGRGYASALLKRAEQIALRNRLDALFLEVDRHNQRAIELFEGLGFKEVGARTEPNVDRILMVKGIHR